MTALLGSKIGINYRIKAHYVTEFLTNLKQKMRQHIAIKSGVFIDGRKYSYLDIAALVQWILRIPKYSSLNPSEVPLTIVII